MKRKTVDLFTAAFVLLLLLSACVAAAQQQPAQNPQEPLPTIQKETKLVLVDTVVTDKKGEYISDLTQKDFRVWEDNKEQVVKTFSFESDASPTNDRKHYMILFFDNSTMTASDQVQARAAALKFLDKNTGANRYMAVVDFGGTLRVAQNFTSDADRLKAVVRTLKFSAVQVNSEAASSQPVPAAVMGIPQLTNAAEDFGVRTLLLALRNMAKGVSSVPGRKTLVLFSSGFPLNPADPSTIERKSELAAAIDACNKSNVAVYPIDPRGLVTPVGEAPQMQIFPDEGQVVSATLTTDSAPAHLVYVQKGGGGGGHGGGGTGHGGGGTGTGGTRGGNGGTRGSGGGRMGPAANPMPVAPYSQMQGLLPTVGATDNREVLYELAIGTGGFVIVDTNDLLGGIEKIAREQNEYYVLGYTPPTSDDGSCHVLKVKVDRGGTIVRSRTGYCNLRPKDFLAGKPAENQLQNYAAGSQPGTIAASMLAPYFFTSSNTARVNVAIEIPSSTVRFEKEKGKEHASINVLGLAYKQDGTVAARFSDTVEFNFEDKDQVKEFQKKPYDYQNQFDIASGVYSLKVVFSAEGNDFGKLEMPLVIDKYDASQFSVSALALSKELRPLNQIAESLDAAVLEDRTPLVVKGTEIVPAGNNQFKKSDLAVFYAELYDPRLTAENPPKLGVQMVVMDRKTHQKKFETGGPVTTETGSPVVPVALKLPLDQLPPGSYELEVRGGDSTGQFTKVRTANFEVE